MKLNLIYSNSDGRLASKTIDNVSNFTVLSDDGKHTLDVGFVYRQGNNNDISIITHAGEPKFEILLNKLRERGFSFPENND